MTAPAGSVVTLEDMEQELQPAPKVTDTKLEGDVVPEEFRGKSVAEVIEQTNRLKQALQISEAERLKALQQPAPVPAPVAAPPAQVDEYKPLTKEQIQALYEEDPLKAFEAMQNDALIRADIHFNRRFGALEGSLASTQEGWARQEFKDEFEVLGPQITELLGQITDKRVLNDKQSWKDLISYVRGQPGNFEKLWEHKSKHPAPRTAADARAEQAADVGFSPRPTARAETPIPEGSLDPVQKRVAEVLGMSEAEYVKYSKMGGSQ